MQNTLKANINISTNGKIFIQPVKSFCLVFSQCEFDYRPRYCMVLYSIVVGIVIAWYCVVSVGIVLYLLLPGIVFSQCDFDCRLLSALSIIQR